MTRTLLSLLAFLSFVLPLSARQLVTGPTYGAMNDAGFASVATDGRDFLALWDSWPTPAAISRRLSPAGDPIGEARLIRQERMSTSRPVWTGAYYLATSVSDSGLHLLRISREGRLLLRRTIETSIRSGEANLTFDGERVLLLARTYAQTAPAIHAWILNTEGDVLVGERVLWTTNAFNDREAYRAVSAAGVFYVVMSSFQGIVVQTIRSSGELGARIPISTSAGGIASIATDGTQVLVLRAAAGSPATFVITLLRDEAIVGSTTVQTGETREITARQLVWTGDAYSLLYVATNSRRDEAAVEGLRLSREGELLNPDSITLWSQPSYIWLEDAAWNGSALVALVRITRDGGVIYALPLHADLQPVDPTNPLRLLSRGPLDQENPSVQPAGSGYLATWVESAADGQRLYLGRLDAAGRLTASPATIEVTDWRIGPHALAVGSGQALVVWSSDRLKGLRFSLEGERIDPEPMHLDWGLFSSLAVTAGPNFYYLAASEHEYYPAVSDDRQRSYAVFPNGVVTRLANVLDTPAPEEPWGIGGESVQKVAWNGSHFALVWRVSYYDRNCWFPICASDERYFVRILDAGGNPVSSTIELARGTVASSITGAAGRFLVLVESPGGQLTVRSYRIVSGTPRLSGEWPIAERGWQGRLVRAGAGFVAAWRGTTPLSGSLYIRPLDHDGIPLGPSALIATEVTQYAVAGRSPSDALALTVERAPAETYLTRRRLFSYTASEATAGLPPAAPYLAAAWRGGASVTLTWQDRSDDEDGFIVEQQQGTNWVRLTTVAANTTSTTVTILTGTYDSPLRLRAWNSHGFSEPSNELVAVVPGRRRATSP